VPISNGESRRLGVPLDEGIDRYFRLMVAILCLWLNHYISQQPGRVAQPSLEPESMSIQFTFVRFYSKSSELLVPATARSIVDHRSCGCPASHFDLVRIQLLIAPSAVRFARSKPPEITQPSSTVVSTINTKVWLIPSSNRVPFTSLAQLQ
jgi:hypothetical protein